MLMKQLLSTVFLAGGILSGLAQSGADIQVHVAGFEADKAYLGFYFGERTLMLDSADVMNSTFSFEADSLYPPGMYLVVLPPEMEYVDLFLDEDQEFQLKTDMDNLVEHMDVTGSQANEVFYNDLRFLQQVQQQIGETEGRLNAATEDSSRLALQQRIKNLQGEIAAHRLEVIDQYPDLLYSRFLKAVKGPDLPEPPEGADEYWQYFWYKDHYFDALDLSDPAMLRTPVAQRKVIGYLDMVVQDPDSVIKAVDHIVTLASGHPETSKHYLSTLFNRYVESERMMAESVMMHIAETYYLTGQAPWVDPDYLEELRTYVRDRKGTLVGDKGKDFRMLDLNDELVSLYDMEADWIVLYFWSYDCGTCKTVTPKLVEMIPSYLEQGVELVSICTNGDRGIWKEKVAEYGLPGIALADPARTTGFDRDYNIISTPLIFVLDKDFVIRYKQISVENLGAVLDYELGQE